MQISYHTTSTSKHIIRLVRCLIYALNTVSQALSVYVIVAKLVDHGANNAKITESQLMHELIKKL